MAEYSEGRNTHRYKKKTKFISTIVIIRTWICASWRSYNSVNGYVMTVMKFICRPETLGTLRHSKHNLDTRKLKYKLRRRIALLQGGNRFNILVLRTIRDCAVNKLSCNKSFPLSICHNLHNPCPVLWTTLTSYCVLDSNLNILIL